MRHRLWTDKYRISLIGHNDDFLLFGNSGIDKSMMPDRLNIFLRFLTTAEHCLLTRNAVQTYVPSPLGQQYLEFAICILEFVNVYSSDNM